jgi:hypothetical protein
MLGSLGACRQDGPYSVGVQVSGSANALSAFVVFVGSKQLMPPPGGQGAYVELCTQHRDTFLNAPIPLVVQQNGTSIYSASLNRFACKLAEHPGHIEIDYLFLQDDGTLLHDTSAGDARVWATCESAGTESACSGEDL